MNCWKYNKQSINKLEKNYNPNSRKRIIQSREWLFGANDSEEEDDLMICTQIDYCYQQIRNQKENPNPYVNSDSYIKDMEDQIASLKSKLSEPDYYEKHWKE